MAQVDFGWMVPVGSDNAHRQEFLQQLRQGLAMIAGHFDSVWFPDHLQFDDQPFLEGWTALTYLAALQPDLKYGHIVLCQLFRNPALLAKMCATFQFMSQGNFIAGIGAGWNEAECIAYHIPFPAPGQRVTELDEALQIMKALWREDHVTFEGKYHQVTNAFCQPKPDPLPPIMVAAFQPRMMRLVARHADWWNTGFKDIQSLQEQTKMLDAACEAIGRDPATVKRTAMIRCSCAPNEQKLKELVEKDPSPFGPGITGTPQQVAEQLHELVEHGLSYFMLSAGGFPDPTTLELLTHEVLPLLNK
ncbi:LLM class flavin-dependent oxidoreductase [Dictyobacter arantiisoli]|uniref:Luciferase-like domain-containing protein n=1 Tax=Dictyobacter arantiisoli TaxID=2014874 RepID=A0A5A5TBW1_9CHLR|nr:LLM class flavin-dependent oxidoreductase [Dictyobacter arantiisoli]GCF08715.1 hypothetical protein KDI_22790 [Dictyobacter arantiisoli]